MERSFSVKAVVVAIVVGFLMILGLLQYTGKQFGSPLLPFMAVLAGFIITGLLVGLLSKGETVVEPGVASIGVGLLFYFLVPTLKLHCFVQLNEAMVMTNLMLLILNGVMLTFVGAWVGEKLQGTYEGDKKSESTIEWGYIMAGSVLGVTMSMLLANLIIILAGAGSMEYLIIALLLGLGVTGFIIGLRSPGVTINEAIIGGMITVIINLDIFKITLDEQTTILGTGWIIITLVLGTVFSFIGGFIGERVQGHK